jgi:ssDNA-binding Zn-finger/Zn-ribbon topoisomerase 1
MNDSTGIGIECPHCGHQMTVYHLSWTALQCVNCKEYVEKEDFTIPATIPTIRQAAQEVFVVESWECGLCAIYDNIKAAIEHRDEMNQECPNDHYTVGSFRIKSSQ